MSHEPHAGPSMLSAAGGVPEQGSRTHLQRMRQDTDLARFRGGAAIPLALLTQRTGAATANAGGIHHTQAAIGFPAPLLDNKLLPCGTAPRPIRLERKVLTREAVRFPGQAHLRGSIARGRSRVR